MTWWSVSDNMAKITDIYYQGRRRKGSSISSIYSFE
nr:MAG TPA: hypothetical protein [Caudoviricetes sp.]